MNRTLRWRASALALLSLAGAAAATRSAHAAPARTRPASRPSARLHAAELVKCQLEVADLTSSESAASIIRALRCVRGVLGAVADVNTRLVVLDYDVRTPAVPAFRRACGGAGHSASEYLVERRFPKPVRLKGG